jgi:hypothetical protein
LPDHLSIANLLPLAEKQQQQQAGPGQLLQARDSSQGSGLFQLFAKEVDDSLTWDFVPWLRTVTGLPLYVKVGHSQRRACAHLVQPGGTVNRVLLVVVCTTGQTGTATLLRTSSD